MATSSLGRASRSAKLGVALGFFILLAVLHLSRPSIPSFSNPFHSTPDATLSRDDLIQLNPPSNDASSPERKLRVFMPADSPNINLCKVVMSGVALGYPLPTLLNWEGDFNRPEWHFGGTHIAKLESLLAVIEELLDNSDDAHESDLALMVDAYDLWFQLPPSVLIQRFHQLNAEADERNRKLWEEASAEADFPVSPPKQNIIVTTAKDCFPTADSGSDPHYELWPDSPMPDDMYGEGTDTLTPPMWDSARKYRKVRPRCVNSGMIMGTMGAMRAALQRCKDKVAAVARDGRQLWSDQALFGEVMGDQEAWRYWVRQLAETWNGTDASHPESLKSSHIRGIAAAAMRGVNFEFGIGLDYNFTTVPPTCSAEEDGYFVKIGDGDELKKLSDEAGVPDGVRVASIPPELKDTGLDSDPFSDVDWAKEPLYTDFYFGVTPVGIHHNAYYQGMKPYRLKNWWNKMWFYPRLREHVERTLKSSGADAVALLKMSSPGSKDKDITYRAPKGAQVTVYTPRRDATPADFAPISWDGVCQKGSRPWHEELFGDDKGMLQV